MKATYTRAKPTNTPNREMGASKNLDLSFASLNIEVARNSSASSAAQEAETVAPRGSYCLASG